KQKQVQPPSRMGTVLVPEVLSTAEWEERNGKDDTEVWSEWHDMEWSEEWLNQIKQFCRERNIPLILTWMPECLPQCKRTLGAVHRCSRSFSRSRVTGRQSCFLRYLERAFRGGDSNHDVRGLFRQQNHRRKPVG